MMSCETTFTVKNQLTFHELYQSFLLFIHATVKESFFTKHVNAHLSCKNIVKYKMNNFHNLNFSATITFVASILITLWGASLRVWMAACL